MTVISTVHFLRLLKKLLKKYPSLKNDLAELGERLESSPFQGIPLGKDCFKIRLSITSKGRGKSGGGRVITCVKIVNDTVYLLTLYDKSEKEDLEDNELDNLLRAAGLLPEK